MRLTASITPLANVNATVLGWNTMHALGATTGRSACTMQHMSQNCGDTMHELGATTTGRSAAVRNTYHSTDS